MLVHHRSFLAGANHITPMLLGAVPFGFITGATAVFVGISGAEVTAMSFTVFAGTAQFAAIAQIGTGAPTWVILSTTFMINLRHVMYAATLAPWLKQYRWPSRAAIGAVLIDPVFALAIVRFKKPHEGLEKRDYILGLATPMVLAWTISTAAGAFLGAQVPPAWQLDFAVPLMFLALLIPSIQNRPGLVAALTGGGLALALAGLPFNLGLVSAALAGIAAGTAADRSAAAAAGRRGR